MSVQVQAALISAGVAILIAILSEVFIRQRARQAKEHDVEATYRKYAEPLTLSSTDLFWRLREIFNPQGAGFYLQGHAHVPGYEHYKALSTLYRMASLLGWIRALRRELFFIPGSKPEIVESLDRALYSYAKSLADGRHVEERMIKSLIELWEVQLDPSPEVVTQAGFRVSQNLHRFLHEKQVTSAKLLSKCDQEKLSRTVARSLTRALDVSPVPDGVIDETLNRTIIYLSVREAWFYRDWQSAIGDLMIRRAQGSQREFEVIGYKDFEEICENGEEGQVGWLRRLHAVIDDLNVAGERSRDARIDQLNEMYRATAEIIEALNKTATLQPCISRETREAVGEIVLQA